MATANRAAGLDSLQPAASALELFTRKKDLKLEDLSRVPAETKAAVIQIVEQTKRRSGWRVYRTLAALGVPRSVFYACKKRESLEVLVGKPCRVYEVLPEERAAICEFALQYPKIGYRKLTWMMVEAGVACRRKRGLPGLERFGSAVALETIDGVEWRI